MNLTMIDAGEIIVIGALVIILFIGLFWLSLRIDRIEEKLAEGPSHNDLATIRDRLADLSGHVTALGDRQAESTRMIRTIQQHLMEPNP